MISADVFPIFAVGYVIVDKLGSTISEIGLLLNPIKANASGILIPPIQGIGAGFVSEVFNGEYVDEIIAIEKEEAYSFAKRLSK